VAGAEEAGIGAALAGMEALFGGFYEWLAGQYDEASGGFFYARSSRLLPGFEPDIESSAQALSVLERSGLLPLLDPGRRAAMAAFFRARQDPVSGLFLDRDPAMREDQVMVARAMQYSLRSLALLGSGPAHPLPPPEAAPSFMASPGSYVAWLRGVDLRNAWRGCDLMMSANHYLERLGPAERERFVGAARACFEEMQEPASGLWGGGPPYVRLSGAFKMGMFYSRFELPLPRPGALYRSLLGCLRSEEAQDLCWVRNPVDLLASLRGLVAAPRGELAEALGITARNLARFLRPDGGFSRELRGSPPAPNVAQVKEGEEYPAMPAPVRLGAGLAEGDMNAGTQALLIFRLAGVLAGTGPAVPGGSGAFLARLGRRGP